MNLRFSKILPGGNATILVESAVEPAKRAGISAALMKEDYLSAEQVGFVVSPLSAGASARLEMMGGEFCMNALRSLAALLYQRDIQNTAVQLECSGHEGLIECRSRLLSNRMDVSITVEVPLQIKKKAEGNFVEMGGISHLVRKVDVLPSRAQAEAFLRRFLVKDNQNQLLPACGFIPYAEKGGRMRCMPLVYVRQTNSFVFETGCGSGSTALALAEYASNGSMGTINILQPSGETYAIEIDNLQTTAARVTLASPVDIVAQGTVYLPPSFP